MIINKINIFNTYYAQLFGHLMSPNAAGEITISVQWGYDLIQEFVYQFQGFCQYRSQVGSRSNEEKEMLQANRDVWALPNVMAILNGMIRVSKIGDIQAARASNASAPSPTQACHFLSRTLSLPRLLPCGYGL